jgi:hypothetical protein
MATAAALKDQELMTQGKDLRLQSCPSSDSGWRGEKQRDEKGQQGAGSLYVLAMQIQLF